MKFSEFVRRYNVMKRIMLNCGDWGLSTAIYCEEVIKEVKKQPFWRREKVWKEKYEKEALKKIRTGF